ncbi:hypothetical protein BH11PSE1_BH11PSE1_05020 [soil metagenome]
MRGLALPRRIDMTAAGRRLNRLWVIVPLSLLVHLAVLLLLLRVAPPNPPRAFDQAGVEVTLFDGHDKISAFAPALTSMVQAQAKRLVPQAEAKPPPQPSAIAPIYEDSLPPVDPTAEPFTLDGDIANAVVTAANAASAASGQACDLTQWLQAALQANPQTQTALAQIPRPARSVANAMMLWNGRWTPTLAAATGLQTLRSAVLSGVASAPEACRAELIRGPVLLTLVDSTGSTVLAVGSGEWRWNDLLADALPSDGR